MSSPYKRLLSTQLDKYSNRNLASLVRMKKYEIYKLENKPSQFQDGLMVLGAYIKDGMLNFRVTLNCDFYNVPEDDVKAMNKDIKEKRPPFLAYYGMLGNKYTARIHPFGEDIDKDLMATVAEIENSQSPIKKRSHEDESNKKDFVSPKKSKIMESPNKF